MNQLRHFIKVDYTSHNSRKYGFMVSELTGEVDNLQTHIEDKPPHESVGFSYAKWFSTPEERDKVKEYTIKQIKLRQVK